MSNRYHPECVCELVTSVAERLGVGPGDAAIFADALVYADIHGVSTHGVSRLEIYARRIRAGLIDPVAELSVGHHRPGVLVVDANNGLGHVQAVKTLDLLEPAARELGVACATVKQSQHFGALSYYCTRAAARDMILLATTNCEPAMSPTGGYQPFFGTNPIAIAFPTGLGFPVSIDLATSVTARGNIIAANREGKTLPEGWALDPEGNPTTDPARALLGTVLTMAGHKGYALSLMVEVLSSVLSGAAVGPEIGSMYKNLDRAQNVGHFFFLIDINAFLDVGAFKERIDRAIQEIKAGPTRPGVDEILIPGERSARAAKCHLRCGVPVSDVTVSELKTLCADLEVPFQLKPLEKNQPCQTLS